MPRCLWPHCFTSLLAWPICRVRCRKRCKPFEHRHIHYREVEEAQLEWSPFVFISLVCTDNHNFYLPNFLIYYQLLLLLCVCVCVFGKYQFGSGVMCQQKRADSLCVVAVWKTIEKNCTALVYLHSQLATAVLNEFTLSLPSFSNKTNTATSPPPPYHQYSVLLSFLYFFFLSSMQTVLVSVCLCINHSVSQFITSASSGGKCKFNSFLPRPMAQTCSSSLLCPPTPPTQTLAQYTEA